MKVINGLVILSMFLFISCNKKEDDDDPVPVPVDTTEYITCSTSSSANTCIDYQQASLTATQIKTACDQSGGTASASACPTTYNGGSSTGVCTVAAGGMTSLYRFYVGTVSTPQPTTEQAYCAGIGSDASTTATWSSDSSALLSLKTFYCRYDNQCERFNRRSYESAQLACDQAFGYLDSNCE